MSALARLSLFGLLLGVVFVGAALAGAAVGPSPSATDGGEGPHAAAGHESPTREARAETASAPPGVQVAQAGYRLVLDRTRVEGGTRAATIRFRVLGANGQPVRDYEIEHEKRMHFIVVGRDLSSFQHLHPRMARDGTWETRAKLPDGGTYRVFADFKAAGQKRTLGADVHAAGVVRPKPLPQPSRIARTRDGLEVSLSAGDLRAGQEGLVEFAVRRDGRAVTEELSPYLGAKGHLVALREGDLAYLHTHPENDRLAFMATYPTAGAYRLFVQFLYKSRVQTAAFTVEVPR